MADGRASIHPPCARVHNGKLIFPYRRPELSMYKLSHQARPDFLQKKRLQMLCFAEYSLYLHFDDEIIITVEGQFQYKAGKGKKRTYSFPIDTSCLMRLLGTSVQRIEVENDENLRLEFSNGDSLILEGENGPYEAYQIRHRGGQIIV
jgi:hypothetical protein